MSAIDYARLLDRLEDGTLATMSSHNAARAIAIHGGTEVALAAPIDFDPRRNHRFRFERRFLIAFLHAHWSRWPDSDEEQHAFIDVVVALARRLDAARTGGRVRLDDLGNGDLDGLLAWLDDMPAPVAWTHLQKRRLKGVSLTQALRAFGARVAAEGILELEPSIQITLRWYVFLDAIDRAAVERRERFFGAYAHALMTTNAYKTAGAQYFGPIVGNTSTTTFLTALAAWRDGKRFADAPLIALDSTMRPAIDRTHTNIVRELWGFLNLQRVPFYNSRVAEYATLVGDSDPDIVTATIGAQTRAWLAAHPAERARAAAAFPPLLENATRENGKAFAWTRQPIDDDDTTSVDARLNEGIRVAGIKRLLLLDELDRAAVVLHLALDADVYSESIRSDANSGAPPSMSSVTTPSTTPRLWIYSPGRGIANWTADQHDKVASLQWAVGDLRDYDDVDTIAAAAAKLDGDTDYVARTCWRFSREVQPGDRIVARKGRGTIIGVGVVDGGYRYVADRDFQHVVDVRWQWTGEHALRDKNALAFTALVESGQRTALVAEIDALLARETSEAPVVVDEAPPATPYTIADAARDLFVDAAWLTQQKQLLERKKNIILQGPPGVGKTYVAKRLASLLMGVDDGDRVETVQFHPSYSYEQFVRGYRPNGSGGFTVANGPLVRLAERAKGDPDNAYVLVVDEINRGHLGKILGEAMMLLEADKRSARWALQLAYPAPAVDGIGVVDDEQFWLPPNLYVIGTMNTADRSLAVVDYALRRRFAFVTLEPAFAQPAFRAHLHTVSVVDELVAKIAAVNDLICADVGLGRGFMIGHSAFCAPPSHDDHAGWLRDILVYEVMPLLEEYWFDAPASLANAKKALGL